MLINKANRLSKVKIMINNDDLIFIEENPPNNNERTRLLDDSSDNSNSNISLNNSSEISFNSENSSNQTCRICLEHVENIKQVCKCTGTTSIVHEECLLKWINTNNSDKCEICKTEYSIKKTRVYNYCRILWVIISLSIMFAIYVVIYYKLSNDTYLYLLSTICFCFLILTSVYNNIKYLYTEKIEFIDQQYLNEE